MSVVSVRSQGAQKHSQLLQSLQISSELGTTLVCFEAAGSHVVCSSQVLDGCGVNESDVHR